MIEVHLQYFFRIIYFPVFFFWKTKKNSLSKKKRTNFFSFLIDETFFWKQMFVFFSRAHKKRKKKKPINKKNHLFFFLQNDFLTTKRGEGRDAFEASDSQKTVRMTPPPSIAASLSSSLWVTLLSRVSHLILCLSSKLVDAKNGPSDSSSFYAKELALVFSKAERAHSDF